MLYFDLFVTWEYQGARGMGKTIILVARMIKIIILVGGRINEHIGVFPPPYFGRFG